jgi:uncharacterized protein YjiS (DUF1127 family)
MSRNVNQLYNRFRRWRRYRETVRELSSLSTHELNDLGIHRGEIGRLAKRPRACRRAATLCSKAGGANARRPFCCAI